MPTVPQRADRVLLARKNAVQKQNRGDTIRTCDLYVPNVAL
jgi:hypothetical protein